MTKPITAIRVLSVCVPTMLSLSVAQAQPVDKVELTRILEPCIPKMPRSKSGSACACRARRIKR